MRYGRFILSFTVLALLLLSSVAGNFVESDDQNKISVDMKKGWNLLPNYVAPSLGESGWSIPGVAKETVDSVFLLNAETKSYSPAIKSYLGEGFVKTQINGKDVEFVPEEIDFFELVKPVYPAYDEKFFSNYLVSGMWVHLKADATAEIAFPKDDDFMQLFTNIGTNSSFNGVQLYAGWNFLALTPDMRAGVTLNDIKGTCLITRAVFWDAESQSWQEIPPDKLIIEKEDIGLVTTLKVANNCRLSGSIGQTTIAPPEIPK